MNDIPSERDWLPVDGNSDLDEGHAYQNFFGKDYLQAYSLFQDNALCYQEDLVYMPPAPFFFYIQTYADFLKSEGARYCADAASCFLSVIKLRVDLEWPKIGSRFGKLIPSIEHVATHQEWYDAEIAIYGSFADRLEEIKAKVIQQGGSWEPSL